MVSKFKRKKQQQNRVGFLGSQSPSEDWRRSRRKLRLSQTRWTRLPKVFSVELRGYSEGHQHTNKTGVTLVTISQIDMGSWKMFALVEHNNVGCFLFSFFHLFDKNDSVVFIFFFFLIWKDIYCSFFSLRFINILKDICFFFLKIYLFKHLRGWGRKGCARAKTENRRMIAHKRTSESKETGEQRLPHLR